MGKDLGKYAMNIEHLLVEITKDIPKEKRKDLIKFFTKTEKCEIEKFCARFNKVSAIYISRTPSKRKLMTKNHSAVIDDIRTASLFEVARTIYFLRRLDISLYQAGNAYRDFAAEISYMLQCISHEEIVGLILTPLIRTDI